MIWQRCCGEEALETKENRGENREIINNINNNTPKVTAAAVTLRSAKNFK
ncbi:unnamed protein product [Meloidogyne enterolobii]|uniref:Uncharacterized protein n=1 Tax=Meloidogyne enterolobii TaxID=390850 RepID=A0ACB0XPJ2_MELEN